MRIVIRIVVLVIAAFLAFIWSRPNHFRVERATTVAASPAVVYAQIANFHDWSAWSPWEKLDPQLHRTYEGPESGVGAFYGWTGNKAVGEGSMKITEATPDSRIAIDLQFIRPFKSSNVCTFDLAPDGAGTKVTWAMEGPMNFMSKTMGIFMSMDKMVGGDFERGLTQLKAVAESAPPAAADSAAAGGSKPAEAKTTAAK